MSGNQKHDVTRRGLLKGIGAAGIGLGVLKLGWASLQEPANPKRALRLAHLTDVHMMPGRNAEAAIGAGFAHLMAQEDLPKFVLSGGDNLTGTMGRPFAAAKAMRDGFRRQLDEVLKLPVRHCAGNHDIWGWNKQSSETTGDEPLWGKNWAKEMLELDRLHYAFEEGGWKFVVLDSVQPFENRYFGGIDPGQFEWLQGELKGTDATTPIVIVSHIPLVAVSPLVVDSRPAAQHFEVPYGSVVKEMIQVAHLISQHANVKLCLSGHIHFNESVRFGEVEYACAGALSGAWWSDARADRDRRLVDPAAGPRLLRSEPGYTLLDLYEDGKYTAEYVRTGWRGEGAR